MNWPTRAARALIFLYKAVFLGAPSPCRFHPTCSIYALEAFESHGFLRGSRLTIGRLLRCRPGAAWGFDPVPDADNKSTLHA